MGMITLISQIYLNPNKISEINVIKKNQRLKINGH